MSNSAKGKHDLSPNQLGFLRGLFAGLELNGISYAWLRNYERFPKSVGQDIDIGICRSDWSLVATVFSEQARTNGLSITHIHERDFVIAIWLDSDESGPPLHIDFFPDPLSWHGLPYVGEDEVFSQLDSTFGFSTLRPAHEAMCSLLSSLLWGGFYKEKYHQKIVALLNLPGERLVFESSMRAAFGEAWHPPFSLNEAFDGKQDEIREYVQLLRNNLRHKCFRNTFIRSLLNSVRHWKGEIRTAFHPPGLVIAVTGPDGAGKSTILAALQKRISSLFGETLDYHWRPDLLPDVGVLLKLRAPVTGRTQENPHGQNPHSKIQSLLRIFYYLFDYFLSWFPKIRKPTAKNHLVLFDRYLDDMAVDPKRYRLSTALEKIAILMKMVPRPDLMFVLTAEADILLLRKQEVPRPVLVELIKRYRNYYSGFPETIFLDAARPAGESATTMEVAVRQRLNQRLARVSPSFSMFHF